MAEHQLPAPVVQALGDLVSWLRDSTVSGMVIGGIAASLLGRARATRDVDVLVWMEDTGRLPRFVSEGAEHGFVPRVGDPIEFARSKRVLLMVHEVTSLEFDISLGGLPFERDAIARHAQLDLGSVKIPAATAEDLIVMKAVAGRARDIADIEGLLEAHPDLDLDRVKDQLRDFSAVLGPEVLDDFLELLRRHRGR